MDSLIHKPRLVQIGPVNPIITNIWQIYEVWRKANGPTWNCPTRRCGFLSLLDLVCLFPMKWFCLPNQEWIRPESWRFFKVPFSHHVCMATKRVENEHKRPQSSQNSSFRGFTSPLSRWCREQRSLLYSPPPLAAESIPRVAACCSGAVLGAEFSSLCFTVTAQQLAEKSVFLRQGARLISSRQGQHAPWMWKSLPGFCSSSSYLYIRSAAD